MKKTVLFDEYNEIDLKPSDLLRQYRRLTEKDVAAFFLSGQTLKESSCPGCHSADRKPAFTRFGMQYVACDACSTLYLSPRPTDAALTEYYLTSSARRYWHDELSSKTGQRRREKIIRPRYEWVMDSVREHLPGAKHIADINTEHYGYIEELMNDRFFQRKTLLNPCTRMDNVALNNNVSVMNGSLDALTMRENVDVVTAFEVADRTADIEALFGALRRMLTPQGLCFMTGILSSGFDLQILWDKAENIYPPDRMNLFSVEGLQALFKRHGFECLEFSTPGILDVELVEKTAQQNPDIKLPRFIEYLLRHRSEDAKHLFQEFLQENLLSSYARIVLKKKP